MRDVSHDAAAATGGATVAALTGRVVGAVVRERRVIEHVQGERLLPCIDEVDSRVDVVDRDDRQDRTEDLLLHERRAQFRASFESTRV